MQVFWYLKLNVLTITCFAMPSFRIRNLQDLQVFAVKHTSPSHCRSRPSEQKLSATRSSMSLCTANNTNVDEPPHLHSQCYTIACALLITLTKSPISRVHEAACNGLTQGQSSSNSCKAHVKHHVCHSPHPSFTATPFPSSHKVHLAFTSKYEATSMTAWIGKRFSKSTLRAACCMALRSKELQNRSRWLV